MPDLEIPTLQQIREARERITERILRTPVLRSEALREEIDSSHEVWLKLELFQHSGTFKIRGALINLLALEPDELRRGVTAVSAGNHAIAVARAAREVGTTATVVMTITANPARVELCRALGAKIILAESVHAAFEEVERLVEREGRVFIHPFEGRGTVLGTATVGLELCEQVEGLEAVVVPVGGGGLLAGIASCVKQWNPGCQVFGVEPEGSDVLHRSFEAGQPVSLEKVDTVADSLGAPHAEPLTFGICRQYVDRLVRIPDRALQEAMRWMFLEHKLVCEPAAAASTAALLGPLRDELRDRKTALIVCGSNIDPETFHDLVSLTRLG